MSTSCEYYESLMSRMLDGDLLKQETDLLREHIRTCKSCRTLCAAFSGMTLSLRDDLVDVPADLAASVMSRIRTFEAEKALEAEEPVEEPIPLSRKSRVSPKKRWMPTVIAACLVLVIGVGAVSALGRGGGRKSADSAETAAYSRVTGTDANAAEAPAAGEPQAMMEESAAFELAEAVMDEAAPMEPAAPETTEAETTALTESGPVQGYTLSDPAFVPEGSEAAFEALLTDAGHMPEGSLHVFYYVEHRGVIYEFMTDESEQCLLWRDAAEGFPTLSQSSFDDLWAIFK